MKLIVAILILFLGTGIAFGKGGSRSISSSKTTSSSKKSGSKGKSGIKSRSESIAAIPSTSSITASPHFHQPSTHTSRYNNGVARDSHGRIARSSAARREFMKETGYPNGRPGYVIDHVVALKRGGVDSPSNMQWQTKEEAKAKDRWE